MSKPWTEEMTERSRQMKARGGATNGEYLAAFGRTRKAVMARLRYLDRPEVRQAQAVQKAAYRRTNEVYRAKLDGRTTPDRHVAPPEVIEDAIRRASAPRSVSAWICGDPPPGWSALERRA